MNGRITKETPLAMLTVEQFIELMKGKPETTEPTKVMDTTKKKYVYGLNGIAELFGCSVPTAARIKKSGKIEGAITQIGRKIIVDADKALELAGQKEGGRKY